MIDFKIPFQYTVIVGQGFLILTLFQGEIKWMSCIYVKYSKIHNGVRLIDSDKMFRFKDVYNLYTYEEK